MQARLRHPETRAGPGGRPDRTRRSARRCSSRTATSIGQKITPLASVGALCVFASCEKMHPVANDPTATRMKALHRDECTAPARRDECRVGKAALDQKLADGGLAPASTIAQGGCIGAPLSLRTPCSPGAPRAIRTCTGVPASRAGCGRASRASTRSASRRGDSRSPDR